MSVRGEERQPLVSCFSFGIKLRSVKGQGREIPSQLPAEVRVRLNPASELNILYFGSKSSLLSKQHTVLLPMFENI